MKQKFKIILTCLAGLPFGACTENDVLPDAHPSTLQVSVQAGSVPQVANRSVILGESLPDKSRIGVFLDANDTPGYYDGIVYHNCCYEATGEVESQIWKNIKDPANPDDKEILLSPTIGTAYAYYPYDPNVTDITRIPVHVDNDTPENQRDYMYSSPFNAVSMRNSKAHFFMQHALTSVQLHVSRGSYTGAGQVSDVQISCGGLAKEAVLNAMTGKLSQIAGAELINRSYSRVFTVQPTAETFEPFIGVPTGTSGQVTVSMKVDGRPYSFTTSTTFTQSSRYIYHIGIDEKKLSIQGITVTPWVDDPSDDAGQGNITLPASIRILGDIAGITFHRSDAGGKITLVCVPREQGREVLEPDVRFSTPGSENCVRQTVDKATGIRTITIDHPTTAISFTFHGLGEAPATAP